jgi:broad specificity phosphatase PhoE
MTRIIFIRHGYSMANEQERFAGHSDFPLAKLGHEQAKLAAEYLLKNEKIDAVYSSGLLRTAQTVQPTADALGLPVIPEEGLREIYAGKWEGLKFSEIFERYNDDFNTWLNDLAHVRCTDGESTAELFARISETVKRLGEENDGKCILLATHATPMRVVQALSVGDTSESIASHKAPPNASIHIYEYDNGKLTSIKTNITEHLNGNITVLPPTV